MNTDSIRSVPETSSRRSLLTNWAAAGGGLASAAAIPALAIADEPRPVPDDGSTFNVRKFGGRGNGQTDDTLAAQGAIDAALKAGGGRVHFPSGRYRVTRGLVVGSGERIDITGDGWSSVLLHENNEHLLLWKESVSCREVSVRHLAFTSVRADKTADVGCIACLGGAERSFFSHLLINSEGVKTGSGILVDNVMDTTTLAHCLMWEISGTGARIARGSEVRIVGGRITGRDRYADKTIGVHLPGGNGGVHILTTDIIGLHTGIKIGEPGQPSNREVFLTHATLDSSIHGLVQTDHTYTSIAGCWAASSDENQILVENTATGAIMVISGGTIFNGGAYGKSGTHHGLVVRAGSFVLSGVTVRHNKGTGILVDTTNVRDYAITGCRIADNGTGAVLDGADYAFTGNVLTHNGKHLIDRGNGNKQVANNVLAAEGKPRA